VRTYYFFKEEGRREERIGKKGGKQEGRKGLRQG